MEQRIQYLEAALEESIKSHSPELFIPNYNRAETITHEERLSASAVDICSPLPTTSSHASSLIAQLCGLKWQLNSDEIGQLRYFGPTSSLHLTDGSASSVLRHCDDPTGTEGQLLDKVPAQLQTYLLAKYWTYQNSVLPVIHKKSFLRDMESGQGTYFSKCLLYCIFASAARISTRPEVRALAVAPDGDDEQPYFVDKATKLLQHELNYPRITTIQSLQLLSLLACCESEDTKGWLYSGTKTVNSPTIL